MWGSLRLAPIMLHFLSIDTSGERQAHGIIIAGHHPHFLTLKDKLVVLQTCTEVN